MQNKKNGSSSANGRDPYSVLILLICSLIAAVLAVAGLFSFFDGSPGASKTSEVSTNITERVRNGELPDHVVRMAYDEVKRLSNTPIDEGIYWRPDAKKVNGGLLISGVVRVPNGGVKEFFVKFGDKNKKIVESQIRK